MPGPEVMTPEERAASRRASVNRYNAKVRERRSGPDGEAMRARERAYTDANREQARERSRRYEARHREKRMQKNRDYYTENREAILARASAGRDDRERAVERAWAEKNKDRIAEKTRERGYIHQKAWRTRHRDAYRFQAREYSGRSRAASKGSAFERLDYLRIWLDSDRRCGECGEAIDENDLEFDHIIPLSKGGAHVASNVQIAHAFCNRSKKDKVKAA